MAAATPARTDHTVPEPAPSDHAPAGAWFSATERSVIITGLAAGTPISDIARALDRPRHHIDRWAARHRIHTPKPHSNPLVVRLALILLGAEFSASAIGRLAGVTGQTITAWARKHPPAARVELDAVQVRFYTALLSGATPAEAAASAGVSLTVLDPEAVYSSDVNTPVAQQTPGAACRGRVQTPPDTTVTAPQHRTRTLPTPPRCPYTDATDTPSSRDTGTGAHRANRVGHSTAATPSRRRGKHNLPEPVDLPIPEPVTEMPPAAVTHPHTPDKPISSRYLSADERDTIASMHATGKSYGAIARTLGRPTSTISREIRRNSNLDGSYNPFSAARCAAARRGRPKLNKVYTDTQLWALVAQGLEHNQSPEQITATLRRRFPHRKEWHVCHETIYQALYVYPRGGLKKQVTAALRTGRAVRKPHSGMLRQSRIKNMINIVERPADIENRLLPGDWEGDLIVGEYNKTAIGTLVDRKTRYVMLLHLPGAHDAISVRNAMIERLSGIPEQIRQSVTWDQGSEMAMHEDITTAVGVDIYFCDPHAPWQRGTNENTNGLLRQYFPKSTDLSVHTPEDLLRVEELMNNRPRKVLDWATPAEVMWDELDGILGDD